MECYYHPERESTATCAICGKSVCEECGLEIAGKVYCKECLEKIVGLGIQNNIPEENKSDEHNQIVTEPPEVNAQSVYDTIYQPQEETDFEIPYTPQEEVPSNEFKGISDDSPYNIKENIEYTGGLESSYTIDSDIYQPQIEQQQVARNELDIQQLTLNSMNKDDFIYPDHDYEPPITSARQELEDKYEKYLDDLYFDENEVPLGEQLTKDEAQYGSLTRKKYASKPKNIVEPQIPTQRDEPIIEIPEEMEARIRAEILKELGLMTDTQSIDSTLKEELESSKDKKPFGLRRNRNNEKELITASEDKNIHNLNYKDEKEPMGVVDILLTIILVIVILIVIYYIVYLFLLSSTYPTFIDAVFAIRTPQNVINSILTQL